MRRLMLLLIAIFVLSITVGCTADTEHVVTKNSIENTEAITVTKTFNTGDGDGRDDGSKKDD